MIVKLVASYTLEQLGAKFTDFIVEQIELNHRLSFKDGCEINITVDDEIIDGIKITIEGDVLE